MKVDMTNHFEGTVTWNDGTQEEIIHFENPMGTLYEFETASGYYMYRQGEKTTHKRLPYDYEDEYYPWELSNRKVQRIQYTVTIF